MCFGIKKGSYYLKMSPWSSRGLACDISSGAPGCQEALGWSRGQRTPSSHEPLWGIAEKNVGKIIGHTK